MKRRRAALAAVAALCAAVLTGPGATAAQAAAPGAGSASGAGSQAAAGSVRGGSPGCGTNPGQAPGTSQTHTLDSGGRERSYRVHLPEGYRSDRAYPVVLAFHGQGRTSAYMEELTGFSAASDAIAVYPQGAGGTEDGKPSWQGAPYSAPGVDDVRFTSDLIGTLERDLCVDDRRVHAAGKSNGGAFVALLACRMPERIASFSAVSGAYYEDSPGPSGPSVRPGVRGLSPGETQHPQAGACEPRRAAPVLTVHGGADTTIPYGGDSAKGLPPIPQWLAERAELAGCAPQSRDRDPGDGVTRRAWHDCAGRGALVHYKVGSLAHDWPSTRPNPDSDTPSVLDATPLIRQFMEKHSMREHPLGG